MKDYQENFIRLALEAEALNFGDFTLKSGTAMAGASAIAPDQMQARLGRLKPSRRHRAFDDPAHLRAC